DRQAGEEGQRDAGGHRPRGTRTRQTQQGEGCPGGRVTNTQPEEHLYIVAPLFCMEGTMKPESAPSDIGRQLGEDGVNGVVAKVEQYCTHAVRHIELENRAPMFMLRAEYAQLAKQAEALEEQLRSAPPPGDMRHHRRKKIFAWVIAGLLTITGFFLAVLTFTPFQLGWQSYPFCIGIAIVVPFLMEELFEGGRLDALIKPLTVVAVVAGIASLMLMADVRGNLLKREVETPPAVVIDDAQPEQPAPHEDFYRNSTDLLTLA